ILPQTHKMNFKQNQYKEKNADKGTGIYFTMSTLVTLLLLLLPAGQTSAQSWLSTVRNYIEKDKLNPPAKGSTFFIGSSTWTQWSTQLEADFAEYQAANRGFGVSQIPDQLAYMDSLLMPYAPARVFFFCGTNDLLRRPVHTVLEDFKTFLRRLWAVYPSTQVYFVSVPHAPSRERIWAKGDSLNSLVQNLADNHDALIYVDVVDAMYDSQGQVREELYKKDRLHMNRRGQEMWIPRIKQAIESHPIPPCGAELADIFRVQDLKIKYEATESLYRMLDIADSTITNKRTFLHSSQSARNK